MLKDMTTGVSRFFSPRRKAQATKSIQLALQGGGAHGAYSWGILDHLLEDGRLAIASLSGTSAGAVNAVMLADGLARGGPAEARKRLAEFWRAVSLGGALPGGQNAVVDRWLSFLPARMSSMQFFADTVGRYLSPYDLNPLNINPLKDLIARLVDFDALRVNDEREIFVAATNVHSGRLRVFRRQELTADVVMASAALPSLFRAVDIDGEPYWDGGFTANPPLLPLLETGAARDILLIQIAPQLRPKTPASTREITNRINEITFNASLEAELRALEFIARRGGNGVRLHRITLDDAAQTFDADSPLKTDFNFFKSLHRAGRAAAARFLDTHFDAIGVRGTFDLAAPRETSA